MDREELEESEGFDGERREEEVERGAREAEGEVKLERHFWRSS